MREIVITRAKRDPGFEMSETHAHSGRIHLFTDSMKPGADASGLFICLYINSIKLIAITDIPAITPEIIVLPLSYSRAIGISSSAETYIIIPAMAAKIMP